MCIRDRLVGVFVLFVHKHQAEVAERKKDGGADTEDNVIVCFRQLLLPDFYPFRIGEFGDVYKRQILHQLQSWQSQKPYLRRHPLYHQIEYKRRGIDVYKRQIPGCISQWYAIVAQVCLAA